MSYFPQLDFSASFIKLVDYKTIESDGMKTFFVFFIRFMFDWSGF